MRQIGPQIGIIWRTAEGNRIKEFFICINFPLSGYNKQEQSLKAGSKNKNAAHGKHIEKYRYVKIKYPFHPISSQFINLPFLRIRSACIPSSHIHTFRQELHLSFSFPNKIYPPCFPMMEMNSEASKFRRQIQNMNFIIYFLRGTKLTLSCWPSGS